MVQEVDLSPYYKFGFSLLKLMLLIASISLIVIGIRELLT